jgi:Spy/CpxP family protein refolding chaperone
MKRGNLSIALYLFVVFISGAVVGALGYRTYNPPSASSNARNPDEWRRQYLKEIQTRVDLTDEQFQKITALLDETRSRFHAARDTHNTLVKEIGEEYRSKVRALLTPEQQPKYEQFYRERDQRSKTQNNK